VLFSKFKGHASSRHVDLAEYADHTALVANSRSPSPVSYLETSQQTRALAAVLQVRHQCVKDHREDLFLRLRDASKTEANVVPRGAEST
jgi:hypothetical protein